MGPRRLLRLLVFLICFSLPIRCCARTATAKLDTESAKVDDLVRAQMAKSHVPGLVLAVVKDGKTVKLQSYGLADVGSKTHATADTVFCLSSTSKPFVATAVMMLVEEGRLRLIDPISKYLDGTPDAWKNITVRHLLTHTSGIPDMFDLNADTQPDRFEQSVLDALAKLPLHFAPGKEWRYSNSNYHLLGMIIRKVTGKSYGDFLRDRIFVPLGMTHTTVYPMSGDVPKLATGYYWHENSLQPAGAVAPAVRAFAGGGLLSTVPDMIKWDAALRTGKLLKESSLRQMWTPARLNDGNACRYGLGWFTRRQVGHLVVEHHGNYIGYSSTIYRSVDDRITVVILDNQFFFYLSELARKIAGIYGQPDYHPIQDKEPQVTRHVRGILDRLYGATSRAEDFTPAAWAKWSSAQNEIRAKLVALLGPIKSMVLVERTEKNGERTYRYRTEFKTATLDTVVTLDRQGRVVSVDIGA